MSLATFLQIELFLHRAHSSDNAAKQKGAILEVERAICVKLDTLQLDVLVTGQNQLLQQISAPVQQANSEEQQGWKLDAEELSINESTVPLGSGGFGITYPGQFRGQDVGVKVMNEVQRKRIERDGRLLRKFEREVHHVFRLHHPNIVSCWGGVGLDGPTGKQLVIVMERLRCTLHEAMADARSALGVPLGQDKGRRWRVCLGMCQAMSFLHAQKTPVLHRDLNPRNVMLDDNGVPKLIDFGNAKEVAPGGAVPESSQVVITKGWVASEVEEGVDFSTSTDVYALMLLCAVSAARHVEQRERAA